jgi:phosphomannomutase
MPLLKSISGFRGTIGGKPGDNLTPQDIVECTAAYGQWILNTTGNAKIIIGRDGRISGPIVSALVVNTLLSMGFEVVDLGLSTTPTVEIAVPLEKAGGGIILTASHNPRQWNALKLLNSKGEFISAADGRAVLDLVEKGGISYASVDQLGTYRQDDTYIDKHIDMVLAHPLVKEMRVRERNYTVVVDAVNSTGAISVPLLLEDMGCKVILLNGEINGQFAHNPEPLKENLTELSAAVVAHKADLGIAVDPDVDRLVFVCEDGELFGEEYTLVAVADYVLSKGPGNTVSNLSSSRALADVTLNRGGQYFAAAVGEVNVVEKMKAVEAVIGGEGNGGIIVPELHYGRDALAGIGLFLTYLAEQNIPVSALRAVYPNYFMAKNKIDRSPETDVNTILGFLKNKYAGEKCNTEDGLKIDFPDGWVHLRPSNTEPIIRVYSESESPERAQQMAKQIMDECVMMNA